MKNKFTICIAMSGDTVGCSCCIGYDDDRKVRPCYQLIPDYIHDSQIKKFIEVRRLHV